MNSLWNFFDFNDSVQAVIVATPTDLHENIVEKALNAGEVALSDPIL